MGTPSYMSPEQAAGGPRSTVLLGYLLLVAGSALRFHIGLVWLVTGLSMAGYGCVVADAVWHRPPLAPPSGAVLPFVLSLGVTGLIVHLMLRRMRRTDRRDAQQHT